MQNQTNTISKEKDYNLNLLTNEQLDSYSSIIEKVTESAKKDNYKGYNKHDGLNSPIMRTLTFPHSFLRLCGIQLIMRSPINLRPLFMVPKTINAKGMALWTTTYLNLFNLQEDEAYLDSAKQCLDWLLDNNSSKGYSGLCWGYPYPWQDVGFFAPKGMPNCIVSCFVGRALLQAYEITKNEEYLLAARSLCDFFLNDLTKIQDNKEMLCLSYAPVKMDWVVMDTSALSAIVIAKTGKYLGDDKLLNTARRLMNYVVDKKTEYDAWYYSHPPERSHITHDNYHTGYIVDAILDYTNTTGNKEFFDAYLPGLKYYQDNLFESDGAPRWMNDKQYPYDIHGSAQGIISFSKAAEIDSSYYNQAIKCTEWVVDNMYLEKEARFYYQKRPLYTTKFTLLRWCNAWMCRALSELLITNKKLNEA